MAEEDPDLDPGTDRGEDEDDLIRRGYETEPRSGRLVAGDPSGYAGQGEGPFGDGSGPAGGE